MRAGCQRSQLGDERVGIDSPTPTPLGGGGARDGVMSRGFWTPPKDGGCLPGEPALQVKSWDFESQPPGRGAGKEVEFSHPCSMI